MCIRDRSWLEPACRRAFIKLAVFSKRRKKSTSARPTKNTQRVTKQLCRCDVACALLFLSVLSISSMHSASGLLSWTMELLAFASRQFAPKTMDLSVRFSHSQFVPRLACEGARSALYYTWYIFCGRPLYSIMWTIPIT